MKSLSSLRISFVCFGFVIGLVAGSHRSANADITFSTTTNLGTNINSSYNDGTPCISRDGLTLYFASMRPGGVGYHDLWVATRASIIDEWSEPVHLGDAVNSWAQDWAPSISGDGLTLYFRSIRTGGRGQGDIWVSKRSSKDDSWPDATNAGPGINTSSDECMPCISADGLELYFGSARPGGYGADDLYVVTRATTDDLWSDPENLGPAVNSQGGDASPSISPDGLTLFFNSNRNSGFGSADLYVITRPSIEAPWSTSVNLGGAINTEDDEMTPSFWANGSVLYFSSWADRPGGFGGADLWQAAIEPAVDLNGDGIVDSADMCIIIDNWGTDEPLCDIAPMLWGDGVVNIQDLIALAEQLFKEILPPGLIAYWRLDQTEGNIAHNSASDNDGVLNGEPLWKPGGGKTGGALQFDGINDYIETNFVLNPADGAFSAFAWIRGGAPGQVIISQADTFAGRTIKPGSTWLGIDPLDGRLMTTLTDPPLTTLLSELSITDNQWHHVGVVLIETGSLLFRLLYLDGAMVAIDTQAVELLSSNGGLYIAAGKTLDASTFFSGLIDDVRIYDVALTAEKIYTLAQ